MIYSNINTKEFFKSILSSILNRLCNIFLHNPSNKIPIKVYDSERSIEYEIYWIWNTKGRYCKFFRVDGINSNLIIAFVPEYFEKFFFRYYKTFFVHNEAVFGAPKCKAPKKWYLLCGCRINFVRLQELDGLLSYIYINKKLIILCI